MEVINNHTCQRFALFFLILYVLLHNRVEGRALSPRDLEIKRYLKKMNKPTVRTVKSRYGEIIDCVDVYRQPSLDHPLLRNHTIQVKPSFNPIPAEEEKSSNGVFQSWNVRGKCPKGTVPIRRIRKSDILRASSLESFVKKSPRYYHPDVQGDQPAAAAADGHEHAVVFQRGGPYFGAAADINVWNPRVETNDFSLAQLWVLSDNNVQNTVEAGVMVYPWLYSDNKTHLFIYWTADAYKNTGCYDLRCLGFVQTSHEFALGAIVTPLSSYDGDQFQVNIKIFKVDNNKGGNWWLTILGKVLGYWPNALLPALEYGSSAVEWGGEVFNSKYEQGSTSTQMGSGHFPSEGNKRAAFFRKIQTFDALGNSQDPSGPQKFVYNPNRYDLQFDGTSNFYYGGPGRSAYCP